MPASRSFFDLCCIARTTVFNVCVGVDELRALQVWPDPGAPGWSDEVVGRARLHARCREDAAQARRLTDVLDLAYTESVLVIRELGPAELERSLTLWLEEPQGAALPGLLWGLCSDPRPEVTSLGVRLCHEAVNLAFRRLVGEPQSA